MAAELKSDWDGYNTQHIARHSVSRAEAEEVLRQEPVLLAQCERGQERRLVKIGETAAGRILVVIHTFRRDKIRVVTAYVANRSQRATYARLRS